MVRACGHQVKGYESIQRIKITPTKIVFYDYKLEFSEQLCVPQT